MVFVKAFAVGIVTGVLAPVVVAVVQLTGILVGFARGAAFTGGGGGVGIAWPMSFSSELSLMQVAVGFAIGFLFMLWRALVRRQLQSS
jgi:hypothetical protein